MTLMAQGPVTAMHAKPLCFLLLKVADVVGVGAANGIEVNRVPPYSTLLLFTA